ncbi:Smr/MutS family protein [Methyloceanibacter sp.]|uniref:Smr/MutS family protein n=1 Tax=Methyloceanibacter sp. TaxID=1965321 RepID=UPI003D6CBAA3
MGGQGDDEDQALWKKVVETAAPLKRGRNTAAPKPRKIAAPVAKAKLPQGPRPIKPALRSAPKPSHVPRAEPLDRQISRQLDKGRLEVEARLDLHGLRQRDAHAQLRRFLKTAQARGLRHVLVITGKGVDQAASKSFYQEDERGVLRNAVPHWLADPEFAALVVSFSQAPRRLGGGGALYVRLRRPARYTDRAPKPR